LSVTVIAPVLLPVAAGLNVTLMLQLAPGLTVLGQLLVWEKSLRLVPVSTMLVMVRGAVPALLSFTVFCALVVPTFCVPNESDAGEKLAAGAVPVPVRLTACGLPLALSAIVRVPLRAPLALGANVTLIAQLAPAPSDVPQLLVCAKSPAFVPLITMLPIESAAPPVFESVTPLAALVVPTS